MFRGGRRPPIPRRLGRRLLILMVGASIALGVALRGGWLPEERPAPPTAAPSASGWTEPPRTLAATPTPLNACRAVDGDTLHCSGTRVRLRGVDTPEYGEPRYREATRAH